MRKLLFKLIVAIIIAIASLIIQYFASICLIASDMEQVLLVIFLPLFKVFEGYLTPYEILDLIMRFFELLVDWLSG